MVLRIAMPSPTSRLYQPARGALDKIVGQPAFPDGRALFKSFGDDWQILYCRGTDVATLVAERVADVGLTGYDMIAETAAGRRPAPVIHSLAPARTSYVCLLLPPERTHVSRIYTEYPNLTRAWCRHSLAFRDPDVISLHGSLEGVVALDKESAGVILVTSGETATANGLTRCVPLLATDLCLVSYEATPQAVLGRAGLQSPTPLELPDFCRESAALHELLRCRPATSSANALCPADEGRTAAGHSLSAHAR